jgi:muramoyltetrapeptide carboxypeptidase LdcA involved in peptidoglycan recycling
VNLLSKMTTVAILPISSASGEKSYQAIAGDKQSVGKTAGQALDALAAQLGETEFSALLIIQNFHSDQFFSATQQQRLAELMSAWRTARDQELELPPEQQAELNRLVDAELLAATARTAAIAQQVSE